MLKVLTLTPHPLQGASSRFRAYAYQDALKYQGIDMDIRPFLSSEIFLRRQKLGNRDLQVLMGIIDGFASRTIQALTAKRKYDVIYIQRQAFPIFQSQFDRLFINSGLPLVFDMDDAVFTEYPIDHLLLACNAVTVGNEYLANYVGNVAPEVKVKLIPTTVDLNYYSVSPLQKMEIEHHPKVGWIGTSSTFQRYLLPVLSDLVKVTKKYKGEFRVIASPDVEAATLEAGAKFIPWSLNEEVQQIQELDIGVMPLHDDEYVLGKCAFKLIQYGGVGVPSIGTDIGANREVIRHGVSGFLSETSRDMWDHLEMLLSSAELRHQMGMAARNIIEERFSLQSQVGDMAEVLREAAENK